MENPEDKKFTKLGMIIGVPLFAVSYGIMRKLTFFDLLEYGRGELVEEYNSAFHPGSGEKK